MPISDAKIEEVRAACDVVDVVGDFVRLKKRGSGFVGLCPFHDERTPSFSVNPRMQIFKCFGCGVGGDVFQFLMRVERLSFPEAVRALADNAGIHIPDESRPGPEADTTEAIYHALRFAARFFHDRLVDSDDGAEALKYLVETRGITTASIRRFGLGYAPHSWDALANAAAEAALAPDILVKAGLVVEREGGGFYDRYRNRVIFPIFSKVGKVIGFGGRVMSAADQPKYINSPETTVYHKSKALYGLYHARQDIRRQGEAILVEGYTDVISLSQAGVGHVVASSGTALTSEQIDALKQYCDRIILIYDADNAGASAAVRGIDLILEKGLAVYVVRLPLGHDPDSFVREQGAESFLHYLHDNRLDFVTFKYQVERDDDDLNTPESEAAGQRSVIASIARISDPLVRAQYLRRASDIMGVPEGTLERVMVALKRQKRGRRGRTEAARHPDKQIEIAAVSAERAALPPTPEEKVLLRLMLEFGPEIVQFILSNMSLDEFTEGAPRDAVAALLDMYQAGDVDKSRLLNGSAGEAVQRLAAEVLMDRHEPSQNWGRQNIEVPRLNDDPRESATSAMALLKLDRIDAHIKLLNDQIRGAESEDRVRSLQRAMMELHAMRREIENRRFLSWNEA